MTVDGLRAWIEQLEEVERRLLAKLGELPDDRTRDTIQQANERRIVANLIEVTRHGTLGGQTFVDAFMWVDVEPTTWPDVRFPLHGARIKLEQMESSS